MDVGSEGDAKSPPLASVLAGLWDTLSRREHSRLVLLLGLSAVAGLMEMLGIGVLLPVIGLFQDEGNYAGSPLVSRLGQAIGNPPHDRFVLLVLALLFGYYILKNGFLVLVDVFQYRLLAVVRSGWARKLMAAYLARPYAYHLGVNSAQLIRNVTSEVNTVLYYVLAPACSLVAELFVVFLLLLLLTTIDPLVAVFFLVSGSVVLALFYRFFRQKSYLIGKELQDSSESMVQQAKEGFGGIKEIKLIGRESFFGNLFAGHSDRYSAAWSRSLVVYKLPTHVIEVVFVTLFAALLAALTLRGRAGSAFPLLAVYAAAAFRLVPSLNRLVTSMTMIKQGSASANLVSAELLESARTRAYTQSAPMPFESSIAIRHLSFRHDGAENHSITDVSLQISKGEMVGFAGKSGSGKTTLIDCLIGLLKPSAGSVEVDGRDISADIRSWQAQIGYIPQHIYLIDDSLRRNIALGLSDDEIDTRRIALVVHAAQLADLVDRLPEGVETFIGEHGVRLSGGQRQRIGIARALYHDPGVLVMDEATSALDEETEQAIVRTIASLRGTRTILIIAHRSATIEACDRVVFLDGGKLVA